MRSSEQIDQLAAALVCAQAEFPTVTKTKVARVPTKGGGEYSYRYADLPDVLAERFDRILMPHPSESHRYLPAALRLAKGKGTIHYYRHVLGKDEAEAAAALRGELGGLLPERARFGSRRVREVGPRWVEMAADIRLPAHRRPAGNLAGRRRGAG